MRKLLAICVIAALIQLFGMAESAQAQYWGGYGGFGGYGFAPNFIQDRIPHFAAYPPVYYSTPIARSYGHSPFPYPSTYWRGSRSWGKAIGNRFVIGGPELLATVEVPPSPPVIIKNPFVAQ